MKLIYGTGTVVCLLIIALFWQLGQTMDYNARLVGEIRELRIRVNTHEVRLKALADEQAWVRESVKISAELK